MIGSLEAPPGLGVGVAVERNGHVLLGKRQGTDHGNGCWALPGGRIDPGEKPFDAACRELLEETGLYANLMRPLPLWSYERYESNGLHFVTLYFAAAAATGQPVLMEPHKCEGWEWFQWDRLPSPLFGGVGKIAKMR